MSFTDMFDKKPPLEYQRGEKPPILEWLYLSIYELLETAFIKSPGL